MVRADVVVAYFKVQSQRLPGWSKEDLSHDSRFLYGGTNSKFRSTKQECQPINSEVRSSLVIRCQITPLVNQRDSQIYICLMEMSLM